VVLVSERAGERVVTGDSGEWLDEREVSLVNYVLIGARQPEVAASRLLILAVEAGWVVCDVLDVGT
jgi:hypothetical protein